MKRTIVSLLMIAAMSISLLSCGSAAEESASSEAASQAEAASSEESISMVETPSAKSEQVAVESVVAEDSIAPEESAASEDSIAPEKSDAGADEAAPAVSFETTDLEGNTVNSADIFKENKITMINLWGTFCGPCIREMPDLEILRERLKEKECGIIGIVVDVEGPQDTEVIDAAKEIIAYTGVTYNNLVPWETIWETLPAEFVPTTYFVDENGQIIGEEAVGARGADEYEALIDELLN